MTIATERNELIWSLRCLPRRMQSVSAVERAEAHAEIDKCFAAATYAELTHTTNGSCHMSSVSQTLPLLLQKVKHADGQEGSQIRPLLIGE